MAFYFFDRCPEEKLPQIEELVEELGLEPAGTMLPAKNWRGYPFGEPEKGKLYVCYDPMVDEHPFVFQTDIGIDHRNDPQVLEAIKRFIAILEPTRIEDLKWNDYDMREFK